ncbi:MAG: hypothetical protein NUV51_09480 [Sulfuricaulis sp.]|nr:hypothetical protein [Sulfuricaulis sp.]
MEKGWSVGCELELSDVRRDTPLPGRSTWDRKDYTMVNSNGVANDPLGKTWPFGGEINVEPTGTIDDQINVIDAVLRACRPAPAANYRSNLHFHVHVPGLADNVELVKRAMAYTPPFELIDPLPPNTDNTRWKRRRQSHHTVLNEKQWARVNAATTPEELRRAHAPTDRKGRPQYQLVQRCGVNFLSLWDHPPQTVEFRHFCLELDLDKVRNALMWCVEYLETALNGGEMLIPRGPFPMQPLIDVQLEERYRLTSPRYHPRPQIIALLEQWQKDGVI